MEKGTLKDLIIDLSKCCISTMESYQKAQQSYAALASCCAEEDDVAIKMRFTLPRDLVNLREWLAVLAHFYEGVSGWWVCDEKPFFEPRATSVIEGVLWWSARLIACVCPDKTTPDQLRFKEPFEPKVDIATARFVALNCQAFSRRQLVACMRTEAQWFLNRLNELIVIPNSSCGVVWRIYDDCVEDIRQKLAASQAGSPNAKLTGRHAESTPVGRVSSDADQLTNKLTINNYDCTNIYSIKWDEKNMVLMLGKSILKKYRHGRPPTNQIKILNALESAKWPENEVTSVEGLDGVALSRTISDLNAVIAGRAIIFHANRSGTAVYFERKL